MSAARKLLGAVVATAVIGAFSFSPVALAGEQDFTLVNHTGVEIHKLFTSPHSSDNWEEDVLGKSTLGDGESVDVTFAKKEQEAHWDLRVEDSSGNSINFADLNLKEISEVVLHYQDGKAWADLK